jgi:hypothetical protein
MAFFYVAQAKTHTNDGRQAGGAPDRADLQVRRRFFVVQQCRMPLQQTVCRTSKTPPKAQCIFDPVELVFNYFNVGLYYKFSQNIL